MLEKRLLNNYNSFIEAKRTVTRIFISLDPMDTIFTLNNIENDIV